MARNAPAEHGGSFITILVVKHGDVSLDHSEALEETRPSKILVKVLNRWVVSSVPRTYKVSWMILGHLGSCSSSTFLMKCSILTPKCDFFSKSWRKGRCPSDGRMQSWVADSITSFTRNSRFCPGLVVIELTLPFRPFDLFHH